MTLGQVKEAALRLLKYMSEHQAEWKEGAEVHPAEAAPRVGLVLHTPLCDAAVELLKDIDALKSHELGSVSAGDSYEFFRITRYGLDIAGRGELP